MEEIIGESQIIRKLINLTDRTAAHDSTVLIIGETGTGKELFARRIHRMSRRAKRQFLAISCAAIPATLLESEMFGYAKGAFTGADNNKPGLFEEADSGTLFLDEISEMDIERQSKLLRVLEYGEVRRLGSNETGKVDVRIIAASNRNLWQEVEKGRFRADLFFRLSVVNLYIPPLREREEDIPVLIRHFLKIFNAEHHKKVTRISDEAINILRDYDYPGNIRELRNIIQHAVIFSENDAITRKDLPVYLAEKQGLLTIGSGQAENLAQDSGQTISGMEKNLIRQTLSRFNGNQSKTAKSLGISRSTLWRKIKQYKLD